MRENLKRPPGNIRRPPGLKIACFRNDPVRPGYGRLALASEGGESKLLFHRRNKKVVATRTHGSGHASRVSFRLPQCVSLRCLMGCRCGSKANDLRMDRSCNLDLTCQMILGRDCFDAWDGLLASGARFGSSGISCSPNTQRTPGKRRASRYGMCHQTAPPRARKLRHRHRGVDIS
jgi:hypothetical protein